MQFAYLVRPAFDRAFLESADERERQVVDEHWDFLLELQGEGRLILAGRCYDGPFGVIVFEAGTEDEARTIMESDPSVRAGVQAAELHPFRVGLIGGTAA